jgi:solute carrier family 25 (adenine nucleotide translocator) protein 4/5/6/31
LRLFVLTIYHFCFHLLRYVVEKEGVAALFNGAGANILRGMAGAGVLAGFDSLKAFYIANR